MAALSGLVVAASTATDVSAFSVIVAHTLGSVLDADWVGVSPIDGSDIVGEAHPAWVDESSYGFSVPIRLCNGRVSLEVACRRDRTFDPDEVAVAEGAARLVFEVAHRTHLERESRRLLEILDEVPDVIGTIRRDGTAIYMNRAARQMRATTEGEGHHYQEFHTPESLAILRDEGIPTAIAEGRWTGLTTLLHTDGSTTPCQQTVIAHPDEWGEVTQLSTVARDLTHDLEQSQALDSLSSLAEKAFHGSPIGKLLAAPTGEIVMVNQALGDLLGVDPGELLERHITEVVWAPDLRDVFEAATHVFQGELEPYVGELRAKRSDGSWGWVRAFASPIMGDNTQLDYVIVQLLDIDEAKRAAEAMKFQETLLDEVHNAVIATDLEGSVIYWNRHAERLFGYNSHYMLGRHIDELGGTEGFDRIRAELDRTGTWESEERLRRSDGSEAVVLTTCSFVCDEGNRPIGIIGVSADLTPIKTAESLAEQRGRLAESVLGSVIFPVAVLDPDSNIASVNHAWRRFAVANGGSPARTGVGVNYLDVCDASGPDPIAASAALGIRDVLAGRRESFSLEYPCPSPTEERWFEMEVTPMTGGGAVVAHWDITAEHRERAALAEVIEAKDRFIATISHELRTPLTAVLGLTELIRERQMSIEEMIETADLIADQSMELSMLVDDLLVAARIEAKALAIRPRVVDIASEVDRTLISWSLPGSDLVEIDIPAGLNGWADDGRLRQILRGLLKNAFRYGRPPFSIRGVSEGNEVIIDVLDHGPGIPPEAVPRLFDHYAVFALPDGQPVGLGLGLPVAKNLAELMGGRLEYSRESNQTRFRLVLPASPEDSPPREGSESGSRAPLLK